MCAQPTFWLLEIESKTKLLTITTDDSSSREGISAKKYKFKEQINKPLKAPYLKRTKLKSHRPSGSSAMIPDAKRDYDV